MPAGFEALSNDFGTILIDDNYENLAVRQSGTLTLNANGNATLTVGGLTSPLMAIRSASAVRAPSRGPLNNGSATWGFNGPAGAVVSYWLFDVPVAATGTGGLQIRAADGRVTFDSNYKYARFAGLTEGATQAEWEKTFSYVAGRTLAVAILERPFRFDVRYTEQGGGWYFEEHRYSDMTVSASGSSFTFALPLGTWDQLEMPTTIRNRRNQIRLRLKALVLDVTGY